MDCPECEGRGHVPCERHDWRVALGRGWRPCAACSGTGRRGAAVASRASGVSARAAAVLLAEGDRVLAVRRSDDGQLGLPCGFVEDGEALVEAARHELWEEAGVDAEGALVELRAGAVGRVTVTDFYVRHGPLGALPPPGVPFHRSEEGEALWVTRDELLRGGPAYAGHNLALLAAYDRAMAPRAILVDMDGVLADFEGEFLARWRARRPGERHVPLAERRSFYVRDDYPERLREDVLALQREAGFFASLPPVPGGLAAVRAMLAAGYEPWICTAPLSDHATCAQEKLAWVERHLGRAWVARTVVTKDKTLVRGDVLIDDRPAITGSMTPEWEHVLFDAPWNAGVRARRRVTWDDYAAVLGLTALTGAGTSPER